MRPVPVDPRERERTYEATTREVADVLAAWAKHEWDPAGYEQEVEEQRD